MTLMGLSRPSAGSGGRTLSLAKAQAPLIPIQARQIGTGATMGSTPLTGSIIVVAVGNQFEPYAGHTFSGGGVTTWNLVGSGSMSGSGACHGVMLWGRVDTTPSASLSGSFTTGGAATAYAWLELRGLLGVNRSSGTTGNQGGATTNPSNVFINGLTTTYAGSFLVAGCMSQNQMTAFNAPLTSTQATASSRWIQIGYAPMSVPASTPICCAMRVTGSNSKIWGGAMLIG